MNAAALYSEQLDWVRAALAARRYPEALITGKHALLPQHDNVTAAHTAALIKAKYQGTDSRN